MNIVSITIGSYPTGEASTNRNISILKGLAELNNQVKLFVISPTNKKSAGNRIKSGIIDNFSYEYTSYNTTWPNSKIQKLIIVIYSLLNALIKLRKMHKTKKIDALLILTTKTYIIHPFIIFSRLYNIKTFHERNEHPLLNYISKNNTISSLSKIKFKYYLWLIKKFSGIYVISQYLKNYFSEFIDSSKICVINMTVDINRFKGKFENPFNFKYIAYCGTMYGNKDGLEYLILAYSKIADQIDMNLVLIGDNVDQRVENTNNIVNSKGLQDKVIFIGSVPSQDIPMYLQNSEILVLSRPDSLQAKAGFPTKLGEYLMSEKPTIVTSVGEIPLFLEDGVNTFIVEPNNIDEFANKILYVKNNYQKALSVAKEGKNIALNRFNYLIESKKLSDFISQTINHSKAL